MSYFSKPERAAFVSGKLVEMTMRNVTKNLRPCYAICIIKHKIWTTFNALSNDGREQSRDAEKRRPGSLGPTGTAAP